MRYERRSITITFRLNKQERALIDTGVKLRNRSKSYWASGFTNTDFVVEAIRLRVEQLESEESKKSS